MSEARVGATHARLNYAGSRIISVCTAVVALYSDRRFRFSIHISFKK